MSLACMCVIFVAGEHLYDTCVCVRCLLLASICMSCTRVCDPRWRASDARTRVWSVCLANVCMSLSRVCVICLASVYMFRVHVCVIRVPGEHMYDTHVCVIFVVGEHLYVSLMRVCDLCCWRASV